MWIKCWYTRQKTGCGLSVGIPGGRLDTGKVLVQPVEDSMRNKCFGTPVGGLDTDCFGVPVGGLDANCFGIPVGGLDTDYTQ